MMNPHALVENGKVIAEHEGDAVVPWWSVGKTVLAAATLALVRDGGLALDATVSDQAFTLRQLLQHRAGPSNYGPLPEYKAAVARVLGGEEGVEERKVVALFSEQLLTTHDI